MQTLGTRRFFSNIIKRKFRNDYHHIKVNAEKAYFSQFRAQALIPFVVEQTVYMLKGNDVIFCEF